MIDFIREHGAECRVLLTGLLVFLSGLLTGMAINKTPTKP